jgi:hypothetical protein
VHPNKASRGVFYGFLKLRRVGFLVFKFGVFLKFSHKFRGICKIYNAHD